MTLLEALKKSRIAVLEFNANKARTIYYATHSALYKEVFERGRLTESGLCWPGSWIMSDQWRPIGFIEAGAKA